MKISCDMAIDLIPLYKDGAASNGVLADIPKLLSRYIGNTSAKLP